MNATDIRSKSVDELKEQLLTLRKEQLNLRFQRSTGQLENTAAMRLVRKDIARVKTVLTEKHNGIEVVSKKATKPKTKAKAAPKKAKPAKKETAAKKKTA